mmetsp:Transcript_11481/g.23698  ORF Transcript_11481/g.23698 Transcript_11481/m.23698 type:complete len:251 (-) Transcript_11481:331-1083(-)
MPNIAHRSCRYHSIGSNDEIRNGTVQSAHSQPCLWRQLQCSTEQVTNDISVANNDFKLIILVVVLALLYIPIKVLLECLLDSVAVFVNLCCCTLNVGSNRNHGGGQSLVEKRIRFLHHNSVQLFGDQGRRFLGSDHIGHMYGLDGALPVEAILVKIDRTPGHFGQSLSGFDRLETSKGRESAVLVFFMFFVVLTVSNQQQVSGFSFSGFSVALIASVLSFLFRARGIGAAFTKGFQRRVTGHLSVPVVIP